VKSVNIRIVLHYDNLFIVSINQIFMETQYNLPIKVIDKKQEFRIQYSLQGYRVFTDQHGNLDRTCFS